MLAAIPGSENDPLFAICRRGRWLPLTDCIVRKHLKGVIRALGWEHQKFTFHTLGGQRPLGLIITTSPSSHQQPRDLVF